MMILVHTARALFVGVFCLLLVCCLSFMLAGLPAWAQNEAEAQAGRTPESASSTQHEKPVDQESAPSPETTGSIPPTETLEAPAGNTAEASVSPESAQPIAPNASPVDTAPTFSGEAQPSSSPTSEFSNGGILTKPAGAAAVPSNSVVEGASPKPSASGDKEPGGFAENLAAPKTDGLPEFAQNQPGFIPDTTPEDLFAKEPETSTQPQRIGEFASLLGTSKLPPDVVDQLIQQYKDDPARELDDNYARVIVPDGDIQGSTETKQFHIEGGLIVFYNEVTITGDNADIDEKNELAIITGNVNVLDPKYTLKTDELRIFFNDKRFQANGFVQFNKQADQAKRDPDMSLGNKDRLREYLAGQQFELYCTELFYNWDTKELTALESVRLVHPSFNGTMERIDYNDETKAYEMSGSVIITVDKYDWIFVTKVVAPEDEKKVRAITDTSTKIQCDRLVYSEDTGVAQFYANSGNEVLFDQTARKLTASYVEINDETKDFYAEGGMDKKAHYEQQNGEWLFTAELLKREEIAGDLREAVEGPLNAEMQSMAYNYERKRLELLGGINLTSGQRTLNAQELIQDETAKYFLLRGNVHIKPDVDSEVYAAQVYLDTAEDVLTFVGLVQGEMFSTDMSEAEEQAASGGTPQYQAAAGLFQQQSASATGGGITGRGTSSAPSGSAGRTSRNTSNAAEGR